MTLLPALKLDGEGSATTSSPVILGPIARFLA